MDSSALKLTGVVSDRLPWRENGYSVGLRERARLAWEAQQQAEQEDVVEAGQRARERAITRLVEAIQRVLWFSYPNAAVQIDSDGYAFAELDGLTFRVESGGDELTKCLLVLDVYGSWHAIDNLARLGKVDEQVRLMWVRS